MDCWTFSLFCGFAMICAVCADSENVPRENEQNEERYLESREKRSLNHLKQWLGTLNSRGLLGKIFHQLYENEVRKQNEKTPLQRFPEVKPVSTKTPAHHLPKFDYSTIYPGTKWCGAGAIPGGVTDLGWKWGPDICCRRHAKCSHAINSKEEKYGIANPGPFTWSDCDCDRQFYDCLKRDNSIDADVIGFSYFNALNNYCIYKDNQENCSKIFFSKVRCQKLKTKPKVWKKRRVSLVYVKT